MDQAHTCLECNTPLKGRLDKKFCNDQCRYLYNNRKKRKHEAAILYINSVLRKNRSILKTLSPIGKTTVRKKLLINSGFNFDFHTHIYRTNSGMIYYFCYEYGYTLAPEEKVILVTYQPYMNPAIHKLFGNKNE